MDFRQKLKTDLIYWDGATGTMLQKMGLLPGELPETWNVKHPDRVTQIHREYFEAGSHIVCTNTFGASSLKYEAREAEKLIAAGIDCAKRARDQAVGGQSDRYISFDIGPLGKMLQPMGDLPFERAVELFAGMVKAAEKCGADLIDIETMNDSLETKAALIAAKEFSALPVIVSNVYDDAARLMTGADPETMTAILEGMGADAIGMNCSLGPRQMLEIVPRFVKCSSTPLIFKPNAGMPRSVNGRTVFDVDADGFAEIAARAVEAGVRIVGGCCGTTPEFIRKIVERTRGITPVCAEPKNLTVVSSGVRSLSIGSRPVLIGERLNPTGKKKLKEALRAGDMQFILSEAISQQEQGAEVLDVNVGLPELCEREVLTKCVTEIQAVCDLPLQIDTSDPEAMEAALRAYNGKAMINSVNGKSESMQAVFPLVKKYGGVVVCLTLDENGIPETAEGRFAIAEKIVKTAETYGIGLKELIFDPLALTVSTDPSAAKTTLDAIELIKTRLGGKCILGVSNVSFGLPRRDIITSAFFLMAMQRGLDAAIMNPASTEMQKAYHSCLALTERDAGCADYIDFIGNMPQESVPAAEKTAAGEKPQQDGLKGAIIRGLVQEAARLAETELTEKEPLEVINELIVPALDQVGRGFEEKKVFLPQLLMSADAAGAAFEKVKEHLPKKDETGREILLATVKGDIHDIGKNIVRALLENYGYSVIDLGRDVTPEVIACTAAEKNIKLVGLSALMTTTVPAMADTIKLLREKAPNCAIMAGGAVLTQEYADMIGADFYGKTAMDAVRCAGEVFAQ
ncbi:MAG: homocysteine S-methyltransferase family protein [Oscillospiraceae bacterium]|nr:homocysteine S-methyltransferase family protein [Oscillospiraceae bacterium]